MSQAPLQADGPDTKSDLSRKTGNVVHLDIGGMTCAACSARIEKVLQRKPGVLRASVNLPLETALVEVDSSLDVDGIVAAVEATGYTARERPTGWQEEKRRQDENEARARAEGAPDPSASGVVGTALRPDGRRHDRRGLWHDADAAGLAAGRACRHRPGRRRPPILCRRLQGAGKRRRQHGRPCRTRHHGGLRLQPRPDRACLARLPRTPLLRGRLP